MYIGIDGGGTLARALLVDRTGAERARAEGSAGIIDAAEPERGAAVAVALARAVAAQAGVALPVRALCCGLAGAGRAPEREAVRAAIGRTGIADHVLITGDVDVAMADAFPDSAGVLLIAGTGSIAWSRAEDGTTHRVGGWGRTIGDEGSGWAIGTAAVRAVLRAFDGRGGGTALTASVLAAAGAASPPDLVRFVARATKGELAALAPAVCTAADDGDATAAGIRAEAVAALVELVVTAARRAGLGRPVVAAAGGLAAPGGPLHEHVRATLAVALPGAQLGRQRVDAARGAARLALAAHP